MIRAVSHVVLVLGLATASFAHAAEPTGPTPDAIDAAVRATVERYKLPGIAVGVIDDGKVVYARGYGETVAGSGDSVTANADVSTRARRAGSVDHRAAAKEKVEQGELRLAGEGKGNHESYESNE